MGVQNEQALSQAFELIEADKLEEARGILKPILDADKDNPDAWWLYAHAVTDPEAARLALSNVRRLDPKYLNAGELLYTLEKQSSVLDLSDVSSEKDPSFLPAYPSTLPGLPGSKGITDEDDWDLPSDEDVGEDEHTPIFRRPIFLLVLGTLVFAVIASLVILQPFSPTQNSDVVSTLTLQNSLAETATSELPQGVEATVTQDLLSIASPDGNNGEFDNLHTALNDFAVAHNGIGVEQTTLGDTVVVSVCTEPGATLRVTLPEVLKSIAKQSSTLSAEIKAISVRMVDCTNNSTLLMIGVPMSDAQSYEAGIINDDAFQAKWQPVN